MIDPLSYTTSLNTQSKPFTAPKFDFSPQGFSVGVCQFYGAGLRGGILVSLSRVGQWTQWLGMGQVVDIA